jgi:hypothetical protein
MLILYERALFPLPGISRACNQSGGKKLSEAKHAVIIVFTKQ